MNYNNICPVCHNQDGLHSFAWGNYNVINCKICELDYCGEMIIKERGGNSSPVNSQGIEMMSDVFHRTNKMAMMFNIHSKYLDTLISKLFNAAGIIITTIAQNAVLISFFK